MLQDAFARLEAEIESVEAAVTLFENIDHAQRLQVVLEAGTFGIVALKAGIQRILPRMTKWCMTQIVRQSDSFNQVFVKT